MKNTRDLGLTGDSHGAGKGDKSRTRDTRTFRRNFDDIGWDIIDPFLFATRVGTKLIRKYGNKS